MPDEVREFDRSFLFPLKGPWLASLVVLGTIAVFRAWVPRWDGPILTLMGVAWLIVCGIAADPEHRALRPRYGRYGRAQVISRFILLLVASGASWAPLFFMSLVLSHAMGSDETLSTVGEVLVFLIITYTVLGLCLAAWLPAVGRIAQGERRLTNLLRLDKNVVFWCKAGPNGFKYWAGSLFFLVLAGSMGELEVFDWWPRLGAIQPGVQMLGFGYWSLLSIRLGVVLSESFAKLLEARTTDRS